MPTKRWQRELLPSADVQEFPREEPNGKGVLIFSIHHRVRKTYPLAKFQTVVDFQNLLFFRVFFFNVSEHLVAGAALAFVCTLGLAHPAAARVRARRSGKWTCGGARGPQSDRRRENESEAQAKAFWPLYDAYEARVDKLETRR
jgi:hypothetical protein